MIGLKIGDILVKDKIITEEQLNIALNKQKNEFKNKKIGNILLELGFISEADLMKSLSKSLNIPILNIKDEDISLDTVLKIPKQISINHGIIACKEDENFITVAMVDPLDYYAIEDVKSITNKTLSIAIASKKDIEEAIELFYKESDTKAIIDKINETEFQEIKRNDYIITDSKEPIITLINSLLLKAESIGASDIHIEPFENYIRIRLRVDGQLIDYSSIPDENENILANRIKIMSNLNIAEKRTPQDGQFNIELEGIRFNVRVSLFPTIYGEKIVLRLLNQSIDIKHNRTFGMSQENYNLITSILKSPNGIVYMTGPTGSGKSTTLYMMLEHLKERTVNISTIEDPVEKFIDGINQTQINPLAGLTFESGLRSLLRQDPDILMVGETRDPQTAHISVSAAITGHLVLSTLHTNDAISAIVRLEDMGIEPYLVANAIIGVVSQRLPRILCPNCKKKIVFGNSEHEISGLSAGYKPVGCNQCNYTGYKGRIGIHEILVIDENLREMIASKADISEIKKYAQQNGYKTLKENIINEIKNGNTSVNELVRLLGTLNI